MWQQKAVSRLMVYCVLVVCLVSFNASAGVIAYYSFDVNAADDSGNGNHGGLQYGAVAGVTDAERGLVLDVSQGTDDRVYLIGTNTTESNWLDDALRSTATIMMWAKINSWGASNFLFYEAGCFYVYTNGSTGLWAEGRSDTGWQPRAYSGVDTADSEWHHYAATIDHTAGVYKIFVDGVEKASSTFTGTLLNSVSPGLIGQDIDGYIDDALIFDEALDEAAIQFAMDIPIFQPVIYSGQPVNDNPNSADYEYAPNIVMIPGESFTYNYVLTEDPDPNVIEVTISVADPNNANRLDLGNGAGVSKVLSFDTTNWNVPHPVTVTAVVEDPYPGDAVVSITHSIDGYGSVPTLVLPQDLGIQLLETEPAFVCGDWGYLAMDFNTDCYVDLKDFAEFAAQWFLCTDPGTVGCIGE